MSRQHQIGAELRKLIEEMKPIVDELVSKKTKDADPTIIEQALDYLRKMQENPIEKKDKPDAD